MDENKNDNAGTPPANEPEMLVNEFGATKDPAVAVDEPDRTVLLTDDETIIVEKEPVISIAPANRLRKVYSGMWGPAEIATAGLAGMALLVVVLVYLFVTVPAERELEHNRSERDRVEAELISSRQKYGDISNIETHVQKLVASADDFEARFLPVESTGKTALYQRINALIAGYGLVNTSGPDFAPLAAAGQDGGQKSGDRGRAKFESLFPGVYVTVTLEGQYHNLRRFIRDIETGNDFVVVTSVALEPSESEQNRPAANAQTAQAPAQPASENAYAGFPGVNQPGVPVPAAPAQPAAPRGKTRGEVVSLRIEMAAYFRRPNAVPMEMPAAQ